MNGAFIDCCVFFCSASLCNQGNEFHFINSNNLCANTICQPVYYVRTAQSKHHLFIDITGNEYETCNQQE